MHALQFNSQDIQQMHRFLSTGDGAFVFVYALKETLIKSIRASVEGFFRLSGKSPRRRSIATSRGI